MGFALGMMAVFWHPIEWQLYDVLNVLNVTELFILSIDFILCEFHQKKKKITFCFCLLTDLRKPTKRFLQPCKCMMCW